MARVFWRGAGRNPRHSRILRRDFELHSDIARQCIIRGSHADERRLATFLGAFQAPKDGAKARRCQIG